MLGLLRIDGTYGSVDESDQGQSPHPPTGLTINTRSVPAEMSNRSVRGFGPAYNKSYITHTHTRLSHAE